MLADEGGSKACGQISFNSAPVVTLTKARRWLFRFTHSIRECRIAD
jgi:hypothetical protein